jgi:cell wall-associated NlpC family hydrolase
VKQIAAIAFASLLVTPIALVTVVAGGPDTWSGPSALARAEIPPQLLPVYIVAASECSGLPWQVLAAIGWVESRHARGRADPATGKVVPPIYGPALDGTDGRARMPDPQSADGWTHAEGPMQFLPSTWSTWGVVAPDRPPAVRPDPQNAWDAIFTAAYYLCGGAGKLDDLDRAILRYNHASTYLRQVMRKAAAYGLGSDQPPTGQLTPGSGEAVVAAAMSQLGVPYRWGAETPGIGFDCSGLVQWSYKQIGIELPRTTAGQITVGVPVSVDDLRAGDLVFSRGIEPNGAARDLGHVALYAGGGLEIVAPHSGTVVRLQPVVRYEVQAARRVLDAAG